MTNLDTIELLKEADKGVQMAILSFDQLLEKVENPVLKEIITESRNDHKALQKETESLLMCYGFSDEDPTMMARAMAWMETNWKMGVEYSDKIIADIITKGCDMGGRNLQKYINQYAASDSAALSVAKRLIESEDQLVKRLRVYL